VAGGGALIIPIDYTDERGRWRYYAASVADPDGQFDIYIPATSHEHAAARLSSLLTGQITLADGPVIASGKL